MWLPDNIIKDVDRHARIYYLAKHDTQRWNENRRGPELRMLTGWCWVSRDGTGRYGQGLKTQTVAYREAWYALVHKAAAPLVGQERLKLVETKKAAAA
jgi:hypothetical protein